VHLTYALADVVLAHPEARLGAEKGRRIKIDLDPTDDPPHGQQELAFFNGHYHTWCDLPLLGFPSRNDETERHLLPAILLPGNAHDSWGAIGVLRRLFRTLRAAFPQAKLRVRLDGGFATPALFGFLAVEGVEYLVAMGSNRRLEQRIRRRLGRAWRRSKASGQAEHPSGETRYAAKQWPHKRRVIMKAEVVRLAGRDPRRNPWFVGTNLAQTPVHGCRLYCDRGDLEHRIKELHYGLGLDRTRCSRFLADAFRVLLTSAAYVLLQELRNHLAATACGDSQVSTLRERLLKLEARVTVSARRIVFHLPSAFPWLAV